MKKDFAPVEPKKIFEATHRLREPAGIAHLKQRFEAMAAELGKAPRAKTA